MTYSPKSNEDKAGPRRFDRLFALCDQELRQALPEKPSVKRKSLSRDEADTIRQAAIQSLLKRPAY